MMDDQKPKDPLEPEVANLYNNDKEKFIEMAKLYTSQYAN